MFYKLSAEDEVVAVSADWDEAALARGAGQDLNSKQIVGRGFWGFIEDRQTRSYLNALFFASRQTLQPISVTYRCDGPTEPKLVRMTISPREGGFLDVEHVDIEQMRNAAHAVLVLDDLRPVPQCSQCLAVNVAKQWVDMLYVLRDCDFPSQSVICPQCRAMAASAVKAAHEVVALQEARS